MSNKVYDCIVCTEILVLPIVMTCSHVICKACIKSLRTRECPVCRATVTRDTPVCGLLEALLKVKVENYDILATQRLFQLKAKKCRRAYTKSPRYKSKKQLLCKALMQSGHNNKAGWGTTDSVCDIIGHEVELKYIVKTSKRFILFPPIKGDRNEQYIIIKRKKYINRFIELHRKTLSEQDVIYLLSQVTGLTSFLSYYGNNMKQDIEEDEKFTIFFYSLTPDELSEEIHLSDVDTETDEDESDGLYSPSDASSDDD